MCGICGWIELDTRRDSRLRRPNVAAMSVAIEHRGPDDWGKAEFKDAAIAMSRLRIIDLGGGHQPIFNDDKTCSIAFNRGIYNFQELRNGLGGTCYRLK